LKSTRRLSITKHAGHTMIRYQWCPTFVRYGLSLLLLVAVLILVTEHSGHTHGLREYIEMVWAVMVLGLILVMILNRTEVRVTADEVRIRYTPAGIFPPRTLDRSGIVSVHHWSFWRKGQRYRLAIQLAFPVSLTPLATREEVRAVAEAIAERLQVDCREAPPNRKLDVTGLGHLLRIVACLATPWVALLVLSILQK
jgi:hypothetical protein